MAEPLKHWRPPNGMAGSHTRAAIAFRAKVREAALRWCDDRLVEDRKDEVVEHACRVCKACEARKLIASGRA